MIGIWAAPSAWAGYLVNNVKDNLTEAEIDEIRAAKKDECVINVLCAGEEYSGMWHGQVCMMCDYEVEVMRHDPYVTLLCVGSLND